MKLEFKGKVYDVKQEMKPHEIYYPKVLTQEKADYLFEFALRSQVKTIYDKNQKMFKKKL